MTSHKKLLITSTVANTFEWYDYALFGHFALLIGNKFFAAENAQTNIMFTFVVFAAGYLFRPLGGIVFGVLGDRYGRKFALSSALLFMALPTTIIAILPSYESIGITSTILVIIVRILQGLSIGGALTSSISFVIEHSPPEKRGLFSSFTMASICAGILLGSMVAYATEHLLSTEQFNDWGWRIPFMLGLVIFFIGLYIRKHMTETPKFKELQKNAEVVASPIKEVVVKYWPQIFLSIAISSTGAVLFYMTAIYLKSYLKITRGFPSDDIDLLVNITYFVMIFMCLFSGYLSDKIKRRNMYLFNLLLISSAAFYVLQIYEDASFNTIIIAQIFFCILAAFYIGPEPVLQSDIYPARVRNTALALSYNIAVSIFGGTTPLVFEFIIHKTGSIGYCSYYVLFCSIMSIIALYFYKVNQENV